MLIIHAPHPRLRDHPGPAEGLRGALFELWSSGGESMFWVWNQIPIEISYRLLFANLFRDVIDIVEVMQAQPASRVKYTLFESTLHAEWDVAWADGAMTIDASWIRAPGGVEVLLAQRPRVEMAIEAFLAEWKVPFARIVEALDAKKIELPADAALVTRVRRAAAAIAKPGFVYRAAD